MRKALLLLGSLTGVSRVFKALKSEWDNPPVPYEIRAYVRRCEGMEEAQRRREEQLRAAELRKATGYSHLEDAGVHILEEARI